jgi:hypothetical protein
VYGIWHVGRNTPCRPSAWPAIWYARGQRQARGRCIGRYEGCQRRRSRIEARPHRLRWSWIAPSGSWRVRVASWRRRAGGRRVRREPVQTPHVVYWVAVNSRVHSRSLRRIASCEGRCRAVSISIAVPGDCLIRGLGRDLLAPPPPPPAQFCPRKRLLSPSPFKDTAHPTALRPAARTQPLPPRRIQLSFITMADNDAQVRSLASQPRMCSLPHPSEHCRQLRSSFAPSCAASSRPVLTLIMTA